MTYTEKNTSRMKLIILYECEAQVLLIFMGYIFVLYMSDDVQFA